MKIFLTGFMGSGKSSVGRLVAERLSVPFVDLDERVESECGRRIVDIFAEGGETEFRRQEGLLLGRVLAEPGDAIVAVGGGTFVEVENLAAAQHAGLVVWLNPSFAEIVRRIGALGKKDRPLFRSEGEAFDLYRARLPSYRRAGLRLDVAAGETPTETAARLVLRLAEVRCST